MNNRAMKMRPVISIPRLIISTVVVTTTVAVTKAALDVGAIRVTPKLRKLNEKLLEMNRGI